MKILKPPFQAGKRVFKLLTDLTHHFGALSGNGLFRNR